MNNFEKAKNIIENRRGHLKYHEGYVDALHDFKIITNEQHNDLCNIINEQEEK